MARQPCVECRVRPVYANRRRCRVCWIRSQGITTRVEESRRRAAMVPDALKRRSIPERLWPAGQRFCGGCQSFVDLGDVGKNASQCKACVSAKSHASRVSKVYGIDGDEYERLFHLQGGRCAICRARPKNKRLAVDHDHKTGAVRGLLCGKDNHELLGAGYDSREKIAAAWHYLDTPPTSGLWRPPEDGLQLVRVEDTKTASKTSRLVDPPGSTKKGGLVAPDMVSQPLLTVDALSLVGGLEDENGRYRLYQRLDDQRPPF